MEEIDYSHLPVSSPGSTPFLSTGEFPVCSLQDRIPRHASPVLEGPVGGRLQRYAHRWKEMGLDPWPTSVVQEGYNLSFWEKPPLSRIPTIRSGTNCELKNKILQEQFNIMLEKGAIETVLNKESPAFYSRLFLVPKPSGDWRPVIDLSTLNRYLKIPKFKMDTTKVILSSLRQGNWVFSVDLKDAYFQVPMHPSDKKYLRMEFLGQFYQFRALPFGISTAPWLFTMIVMVVKELFHRQGLTLFQYLDDWLGDAETRAAASERAELLVKVCTHLGFLINTEKSELIPTQVFDFVGMHFDLAKGRVHITEKNKAKVQKLAKSFLGAKQATAQKWQSLIGTLQAQAAFIYLGKLKVRPLQFHLAENWDQGSQPQLTSVNVPVWMPDLMRWWLDEGVLSEGVPLQKPKVTHRMFTDASNIGWGAHLDNATCQGTWLAEEQHLHINCLEMRAVRLALLEFQVPQMSYVLVSSDNTTVVAYINKLGGTKSWILWQETQMLFQIVTEQNIQLSARYIPGKLNVIADGLSRRGQILPTEWSLHPRVVELVFNHWGAPLVDLFATRLNHKCPTFVSPVPDSLAWDVDALSISWEGLDAYAFPPTPILSQVLQKYKDTRCCRILLIAPWWPRQSWFPTLQQLTQVPPLDLPVSEKMLRQPTSSVYHQAPEFLALHAWLLFKNP